MAETKTAGLSTTAIISIIIGALIVGLYLYNRQQVKKGKPSLIDRIKGNKAAAAVITTGGNGAVVSQDVHGTPIVMTNGNTATITTGGGGMVANIGGDAPVINPTTGEAGTGNTGIVGPSSTTQLEGTGVAITGFNGATVNAVNTFEMPPLNTGITGGSSFTPNTGGVLLNSSPVLTSGGGTFVGVSFGG